MKTLKQILVSFLIVTSLIACSKDEDPTQINIEKGTLSAKWTVDGANEYVSFEFNESGNYIVVKEIPTKIANNSIVYFGSYEIIAGNTVVLSDLGTLKVSDINEATIRFSLILTSDPSDEIDISATKEATVASSAKTDLLCRTWKMVTVNGEEAVGTPYDLTVLFSDVGTYFVSFINPVDESDGGLAEWIWKDTNEEQICYSWDGAPICELNSEVAITELTADKLTINESGIIYTLQPSSNGKSAVQTSSIAGSNLRTVSDFFNK